MDREGVKSTLQLSQEDAAMLVFVGQRVGFNVKFILAEVALYGSYCVLVVLALYTMSNRQQTSAQSIFLMTVLVITFTLVTVICIVDFVRFRAFITTVLIDDVAATVSGRLKYYAGRRDIKRLNLMMRWIGNIADTGLLFFLNDALASWRALAIWHSESRFWMRATLMSLLFVSFAFWLSEIIYAMFNFTHVAVDNFDISAILGYSSSSASIAVNLCATAMIAFKFHQHRLLAAQAGVRLRSLKILLLLVESGFLYATIQIARLALAISIVPSTPVYGVLHTAQKVFESISQIVTAIYTPATILIISSRHSIADTVQLQTILSGVASSHWAGRPDDPEVGVDANVDRDVNQLEMTTFKHETWQSGRPSSQG